MNGNIRRQRRLEDGFVSLQAGRASRECAEDE
jgi:hypothetical protein